MKILPKVLASGLIGAAVSIAPAFRFETLRAEGLEEAQTQTQTKKSLSYEEILNKQDELYEEALKLQDEAPEKVYEKLGEITNLYVCSLSLKIAKCSSLYSSTIF